MSLLMNKNLSVFSIILINLIITSTTYAIHFDVRNQCNFTVWAASTPGGGKELHRGQTWSFDVNTGSFAARIWARTECSFDKTGRGHCLTGDCGGLLKCQDGGQPPYTMAEYQPTDYNVDFLDISLVDGFNVPMDFSPTGGLCSMGTRCVADIVRECPKDLRAPGGCNSACTVFHTDQHCCTGTSAVPGKCSPTSYSRFFKARCPTAYTYPYDDETGTFTCPRGTDYRIVFCP